MSGIVGIMGGTFNPVHNGHIAIAKAAHEQFNIPYILVMPSYSPAYKDNSNIVSATHRLSFFANVLPSLMQAFSSDRSQVIISHLVDNCCERRSISLVFLDTRIRS